MACQLQKKRGAEESLEAASNRARKGATRPNILVTGTPGVGKTAVAEALAKRLGLECVGVSALAASISARGLGRRRGVPVLDEDKVLDAMEPKLGAGGCVVEYHACELFPERWFDLVLVLRAGTEILYDRLAARGYAEAKLQENLQCEIMQTILEEAREARAGDRRRAHQRDARGPRRRGRPRQWHAAWLANNRA
ncbi:adenylate kinase [Aureococcus anophagefferens]|nr:adenylate kinase [Aureococcus anophagefferens]